MSEKKQSAKERREAEEMIREEIESGNPFSEWGSFASYRASTRKKSVKKVVKEAAPKTAEEEDLPF